MSIAAKPGLFALVASVAACGDNHGGMSDDQMPDVDAAVDVDAPPEYVGPCWPEGQPMPRGTAALGTGRDGFQQMPDVLPLEYGFQDGFMFIASVRMSGFAPGNPADVLNPYNPRTRIRAFFADTNVPLAVDSKCPFRTGYTDLGNGEYELVQEAGIVFDTCWRADRLIGKQFRIELDLTDYAGVALVSDTKIVTAAEPVDPNWPREQNTPGCPAPTAEQMPVARSVGEPARRAVLVRQEAP